MSELKTLDNLLQCGDSIKGKVVLLRTDMNVPMFRGKVSDNTRIIRTIPTINALSKHGAKVVIISHFGRPNGEFVPDLSLAPIADAISIALSGKEVQFGVDCIGHIAKNAIEKLEDGEIILLENLRFHKGEKKNDPEFVRELSELADIYINDAFSCSHRSHASIYGIAKVLPSYAGYLLESEIKHLESALNDPERPLSAVVGGAKISTKIDMLKSIASKVDYLFIGGGMANTFLFANGFDTGNSLCEKNLRSTVVEINKIAQEKGTKILLPSDVVLSSSIEDSENCFIRSIDDIPSDKMILDIGPVTIMEWMHILQKCNTVLWNGPLGAFEHSPFDAGTITLARMIAGLTYKKHLRSVAGGGDILAALKKAGLRESFSYVSTAGGAFLEWLEGKDLSGVNVLYSS